MIKRKEDEGWLMSIIPPGAKDIKILYDPVKHGWKTSKYHDICDDHQHPTITVIKSKSGNIFGGYTSNLWLSTPTGCCGKGKDTFIFSLDLKRIFP